MKIDPDRLRSLRKKEKLSLVKLAEKTKRVNPPGITDKTIQRLESASQQNTAVREHTVESLVKALNVDVRILTGELPLPESDKVLTDNPERVQIGAQIAPKARLAYDLIKRRYGVSATEIINLAPLFFALLAEGSLAQRREKLEEAEEVIKRLNQIETAHRMFGVIADYGDEAYGQEGDSIARADIFGNYLFKDYGGTIDVLVDEPFDPDEDNPFAHYLRKLADELTKPDDESTKPKIVDVHRGDLLFGSPPKFPDYDICSDELDRIANGSPIARICLETGYARISEIPKKLMAEDADEEREKWLENKLLNIIKEISEKDERNILVQVLATSSQSEKIKKALEEAESRRNNSEVEKGGKDQ